MTKKFKRGVQNDRRRTGRLRMTLQLVLLSVIMVGQKVAARASDKQALETYKDAEALLKIQDEVHRLIEINNELTQEIHRTVVSKTQNEK